MKFSKLLAFVLSGLFCSFVFLSCDSDDDNGGGNVSGKFLPKEIVNEDYKVSFAYNDANRMVSFSLESLDGANVPLSSTPATYSIIYDNENKIDSVIISYENAVASLENDTISFSYEGRVVTAKNGDLTETISLNENDRVVEYSVSDGVEPVNNSSVTFEYDNAGNIIKGENGEAFAYDAKNGMFKYVAVPQWFIVTQVSKALNVLEYFDQFNIANNCTKNIKSTATESVSFVYEYNSSDFPVARTAKSEENVPLSELPLPSTIKYMSAK